MNHDAFFGKISKLGFYKSEIQPHPNDGVTYEFSDDRGRVSVTIQKFNKNTFIIIGKLAKDLSIGGLYSNEGFPFALPIEDDGLKHCHALCKKVNELSII